MHDLRLPGCDVELYFDKRQLIDSLLRFEVPQVSVVAPTGYGKTLISILLSLIYKGNGTTYNLGSAVTDADRVIILTARNRITGHMREFERLYPGCVDWNDPSRSPVITTSTRVPNTWRTMTTFVDKIISNTGKGLSPMNKVVLVPHTILEDTTRNPNLSASPWSNYLDRFLVIVDEADVLRNVIRTVLDARPPSARAITLSAASHVPAPVVEERRDAFRCITISPDVLIEEKPSCQIDVRFLESDTDHMHLLLDAMEYSYTKIVYIVPNKCHVTANSVSTYLIDAGYATSLRGNIEIISGIPQGRVAVIEGSGIPTILAEQIKYFNQQHGHEHGRKYILVVKASSLVDSGDIDADYAIIKGHHEACPSGLLHNANYKQVISHIAPITLHHLVGRLSHVHNKRSRVHIVLTYYGTLMVTKDVEIVARLIVAIAQLKRTYGITIPMTRTYVRVNRLLRVLGVDEVEALSDRELLYHVFPNSHLMKERGYYDDVRPSETYSYHLLRLYRARLNSPTLLAEQRRALALSLASSGHKRGQNRVSSCALPTKRKCHDETPTYLPDWVRLYKQEAYPSVPEWAPAWWPQAEWYDPTWSLL